MTWLLVAAAALAVPPVALAARIPPRPDDRLRSAPGLPPRLDRWGAATLTVALLVLLPWPWALPTAAVGGTVALRVLPAEFTRGADRQALQVSRSLPDSVDLLAAVLRAGLTDIDALTLVAEVSPGPLGDALAGVAGHRRLGASPKAAWRVAAHLPAVADLAAAMTRHAETGAAITPLLDRVAADARQDYFTRAQAAARSAAVRAVIPLAACFLPAFALLGVVPIVAALMAGLDF